VLKHTHDKRYLKPHNEVVHAYASHEKARRFFKADAATPLADGIGKMAAWVKKHGSRQTLPFENIEIADGLPEGW
jgi:hypothetical protein